MRFRRKSELASIIEEAVKKEHGNKRRTDGAETACFDDFDPKPADVGKLIEVMKKLQKNRPHGA